MIAIYLLFLALCLPVLLIRILSLKVRVLLFMALLILTWSGATHFILNIEDEPVGKATTISKEEWKKTFKKGGDQ